MRNAYTIHRPVVNDYLVRERDRRRLWNLGAVFLILAPIALAFGLFTWLRLQVLDTGYAIGKKEAALHELQRRVSQLRVEASYLASPALIEKKAVEELAMAPPERSQILFYPTGSATPEGP